MRLVAPTERTGFRSLLAQEHYLGNPRLVGESLCYVAECGGVWLALLAWAAAARYCGARDAFLGWTEAQRRARRHLVVNNARFLVRPGACPPHLASQVLGANLRRLSRDWQRVYGHPVWLAETFVDRSRFRGTCYRAANWIEVGETQGWGRAGPTYRWHGIPKGVWLYPLVPRAFERLRAPLATDVRAPEEPMHLDVAQWPVEGEGGLFEVFATITDPRHARGKRHTLRSLLALAACAMACGAKSIEAIAQWSATLPEEHRRRLGGRRRSPNESTFRKTFARIDMAAFEQAVGRWMAAHALSPGHAVAVDGKTLRGTLEADRPAVHLLSAMVHETGTVVAQRAVGEKTNEIPELKPLLEPLDLRGTVVTADALHTQTETARYLVNDKGADYVLVVKENQPTLLEDIQGCGLTAFPPSAHDDREGPRPAGGAHDPGHG